VNVAVKNRLMIVLRNHGIVVSPNPSDNIFLMRSTPISTKLCIEILHEANIHFLRYSSFGMKSPIRHYKEIFDQAIIYDNDIHLNRYDFGYNMPSDFIYSFGIEGPHEFTDNVNVTVGTMFNGIKGDCNVLNEANVGGSISAKIKRLGLQFKIMIYPHVLHFVKSFNVSWKIPANIRGLRSRLESLKKLSDYVHGLEENLIGGFRVEITCFGATIEDTFNTYEILEKLTVSHFYRLIGVRPLVTEISIQEYLQNIRFCLTKFEELWPGGRNENDLSDRWKQNFVDLMNAFGINYNTHPSPSKPHLRNVYWKTDDLINPVEDEQDVVVIHDASDQVDQNLPPREEFFFHDGRNDDIIREIHQKTKFRKTTKGNKYTYTKLINKKHGGQGYPTTNEVAISIFNIFGDRWMLNVFVKDEYRCWQQRQVELANLPIVGEEGAI
jgi:hypothetical protein